MARGGSRPRRHSPRQSSSPSNRARGDGRRRDLSKSGITVEILRLGRRSCAIGQTPAPAKRTRWRIARGFPEHVGLHRRRHPPNVTATLAMRSPERLRKHSFRCRSGSLNAARPPCASRQPPRRRERIERGRGASSLPGVGEGGARRATGGAHEVPTGLRKLRHRLAGIGDSCSISAHATCRRRALLPSPIPGRCRPHRRARDEGRRLLGRCPAGDIVDAGGAPAADAPSASAGLVIPGLPNLHSHAFQRAMAGLAERAGPEGDSFWSWREVMYRFLAVLTPEDIEAIAAQLYVECLKNGYTTIGEFHYLHNDPDGRPYDDPAELSRRILAAAEASGIGLALLPSLYQSSQFGGAPPTRRAAALHPRRRCALPGSSRRSRRAGRRSTANWRLGLAPHSLRAVTEEALARALALRQRPRSDDAGAYPCRRADQGGRGQPRLQRSPPRRPAHRPRARARAGASSIARTLMPASAPALPRSGAVAGLCPTTEANLGDGFFQTPEPSSPKAGASASAAIPTFRRAPSRSCAGSNMPRRLSDAPGPQRRRDPRRAPPSGPRSSSGPSPAALVLSAAPSEPSRPGGAPISSCSTSIIPRLLGRPAERLLDAFVFNGNDTPVRDVHGRRPLRRARAPPCRRGEDRARPSAGPCPRLADHLLLSRRIRP